jgi:hypothetical protein
MEQKCLINLTRLKTEMEKEKSALAIPNTNLNLAKISALSEGIKNLCGKKIDGILTLAQAIENFKKDLNHETQIRLQAIITNVETIIQNNQK